MCDSQSRISKEDVIGVFEALNDQLITNFNSSSLTNEELDIIVENYRCIFKELNDAQKIQNIKKEEIMDSKLIRDIQSELSL